MSGARTTQRTPEKATEHGQRAPQVLDRRLALDMAQAMERCAVAAARLRGHGDEQAADIAAMTVCHREVNEIPVSGTLVIGEGIEGECDQLFVGEKLGRGGAEVDLAVDALEGTTLCAKNMEGSLCVLVLAEHDTLLKMPPCYMEKIAIGPGYPEGIVSLSQSPQDNIRALAEAKGVPPSDVTALILDRPRHAGLIDAVRKTGAAIKLITDGDVAGVVHTANPHESGIDIYLGLGGAAEGVLAAAALRCIGGQMEGRLVLDTEKKRAQAKALGITDFSKVYKLDEMVRGDCLFAATGVTDGALLKGVRFGRDVISTDTIVMRAATGTVRRIATEHRDFSKFRLA
ncbi:fructose-1,6-bisphosphatase II / sedoheptulose-1,7-bisphosphatase [Xanthobacter flavus]|uniref:Fructose-1,6-bisphosphatase n=1 Tax=Xanthobacter flavus TaxID=281 RepID=A0A9W6FM45_XANFL|nr:class II fructose-bisphosphatase [Xanthobacter flavus]MDR6336236.1 fructose-1,6-bisphosphatase II / sedoheptulose-1,7-bisphosphatase [Xanthobacter flavus]GLI25005.1 fructose-1,6-bisphosphatase [Xanthobacter flavus]